MLCVPSPEQRFPVRIDVFAQSLERVVEEILAGTSCTPVMQIDAA
ncbi:hypothetical protein [Sphingomonas limnosediminicola]